MRILRTLRRIDIRRGRLARHQKAVLKLLFNQFIRLALSLALLGWIAAAFLAWRGVLPLPAGWMLIALALPALSAVPIWRLRRVNPPSSAFMHQVRAALRRAGEDGSIEYRWVDYEDIHPFMRLAAFAVEDPDFPVHTGFAVRRMLRALRENRRRTVLRGESTITQQLAKNLFLTPAQTYCRKLVEAYLTILLECLLPKRRILELYLNIVQLDRAVFGVGAAAAHYFGKSAGELTAAEAALLAAVLPNPVHYRVDRPSAEELQLQAFVLHRMEELGLPILKLVEGRRLDFVLWSVRAFYLSAATVYPWRSYDAALRSLPSERDPFLYASVINQFLVSSNPRYTPDQQGKGETYCNIFVWDVTRAMGAEIPHWVDGDGSPADDGMGRELDANGLIAWLETGGRAAGWETVAAEQAQSLANRGFPVVAAWENPGGIGHVAVVRPGEHSETDGPAIAQSGSTNFNIGTVEQGFRSRAANRNVLYFFHP